MFIRASFRNRAVRGIWGSSYLLAFLSAQAMHGAAQAGGSIVQPDVADDRLYRWVSGIPTAEPPRIGTVPNHFVVGVRADARHVAEAAVGSLDAAWLRACDAVWARFVEPACLAGNETQDPEPFTATVAAGGGVAHIGSRMESGFGLVAVGVWPDAAD